MLGKPCKVKADCLKPADPPVERSVNLPSVGFATQLNRKQATNPIKVCRGVLSGDKSVVGVCVWVSLLALLTHLGGNLLPSRPVKLKLSSGEPVVPDRLWVAGRFDFADEFKEPQRCFGFHRNGTNERCEANCGHHYRLFHSHPIEYPRLPRFCQSLPASPHRLLCLSPGVQRR